MKFYNILTGAILVAMLASCSAAYKTDQTPDDLYYSPGKPVGTVQQKDATQNDYAYNQEDDNYLRMKVQNRNRWSSIDDYAYWNSYNSSYYGSNTFGYSSFYNNYWDSYSYNYNPYLSANFYGYGYGYSYNPYAYYSYGGYGCYNYYSPGVYYKTVTSNSGPKANLGAYVNHTYNNNNFSTGRSTGSFVNGNSQPQSGVGRLLRTIVTGGSSYSNNNNTTNSYARPMNSGNTYSAPASTPSYTPSSSSSSSSSSSAGSSRTSGSSSGGARSGRN